MIPWQLIDRAAIPRPTRKAGQGAEICADSQLVLYRRGEEYSIRVDNWELMNSRSCGSEQEIAVLACQRLGNRAVSPTSSAPGRRLPCVLVGGLGMGFTLRAALDLLPEASHVVVAELVPEVVGWNREHLGHLAGNPLDDPRVEVYLGDVAERLRSHAGSHDAIMLDVDNGPHTKSTGSEGWLYSDQGLDTIRRSLRSKGVVSIWSAGPSPGFAQRLERRGFDVEEIRSQGKKKGHRYRIWLGQRTK